MWLTIGLGLSAALAIVFTIFGLRADALAEAGREESNLAIVLGREISESNRAIEVVLDDVQSLVTSANPRNAQEYRERLGGPDVAALLRDEVAKIAKIDVVSIVGDNGDLVSSSRSWPAPAVNLAHENQFIHLSENDSRTTYISRPERSHVTNEMMLFFGRRINGPDGKFLGVIHVGMKLNFYYSIYSAIAALKDKTVMIARRDGAVLVRYPDASRRLDDRMPADSPWHGVVAAGGGLYESPGYFDQKRRLVAVHPLDDYPLVVDVTQSKDAILALWQERSAEIGLGSLFALLCAALLARAQFSHFHRLTQSERSLAARGEETAMLSARFGSVLDNMPHGVALFAGDRRLIVANRRYGEMYGISETDVRPGTLLEEILARRVANGIFVEDSHSYIKMRLSEIQSAAPRQSLDRLSNGQVIFITRRPMGDGGWLTIHEDVTARQEAEDKIETLALYDQLTGAANRVLLLREMRQRLEESAPVGIVLIDLDEFKAVNDTYGHPFGDSLLKAVAERLREAVGLRGLVARIGGDEFAVLHTEADVDEEASGELAVRMLETIRAPFEIDGFVLGIRPSLGLARAPRDGADVETLLRNADLALYRAKTEGRDRIAFFEPGLEREIREQRELKAELADAITLGQFEVHYQPIVDARTHEIIDVEALVRWRHPERGMIRPDHFIKLAEQTGQIQAIGAFVLRVACRDASRFPRGIGVSVNLSPAQFGRGNLVALVKETLSESGLAPERLTLEVTETALMENIESSRGVLAAIRDIGVRIALDDFGTGYSSLSYLQSFALDKIKIDRSFVMAMETNSRTQSIVALIAAIARCLGATTIAEGVETLTQLDLIVAAGCQAAQGYFFSRPVPLEALRFDEGEAEAHRAA